MKHLWTNVLFPGKYQNYCFALYFIKSRRSGRETVVDVVPFIDSCQGPMELWAPVLAQERFHLHQIGANYILGTCILFSDTVL